MFRRKSLVTIKVCYKKGSHMSIPFNSHKIKEAFDGIYNIESGPLTTPNRKVSTQ